MKLNKFDAPDGGNFWKRVNNQKMSQQQSIIYAWFVSRVQRFLGVADQVRKLNMLQRKLQRRHPYQIFRKCIRFFWVWV